jgi:hypothetical protein
LMFWMQKVTPGELTSAKLINHQSKNQSYDI